ncbi:hypothetical protein A2V71_01490 [Candidatus Berkelbacteria bacterium RBG_13_40_8]|uniref:N-acetyltransferase domain-containing protein n=1 Tax=Candidatus Berkelbacteria bacterium RBG_13_40_8 TaxID=1797467 RepID=A0A1F5DNN1_9BACT|nr:MAG: hypothetical protein A2V71_01490 [Candidatus Berkelbacteria bacterium RBG_13_40_8]
MAVETMQSPDVDFESDETQEKRQKALSIMEQRDIISYGPNNEIICDIDNIDHYNTDKDNYLKSLYPHGGFSAMQDIFENTNVISKEDWKNGVREPKPLFYEPKSDQNALDPIAIKNSDFYLNPSKGKRETNFSKLEEVSPQEATLALLLVHPRFGDGFRDPKTNAFMIRDSKRKYRKITAEQIEQTYKFSPQFIDSDGKRKRIGSVPKRFLKSQCQHLVNSGLISLEDFSSYEDKNQALFSRPVEKNGFVFIDGIRYYIGKGLPDAKVTILNNTGVVRSGDDQITNYFRLRPDLREENNPLITLNAEQTNLQTFDRDEFSQRFDDEKDEDYQKRMEGLRELEMKSIRTAEIPPKDKQRMKEISQQNWSQIDDKELGNKISSDFANFLDQNKPSRFYLAQVNNELTGFVRFDDISTTEVYAGSLNVNSRSRGAQIGESLLKSCLLKEAEDKIVKATAYPKLPITSKYIGGSGFAVTGIENYPGTAIPFFQMEIDKERNQSYRFSKGDRQEALTYYQENKHTPDDEVSVLRYNPDIEMAQMMSSSAEIFNLGNRVMTAYLDDPEAEGYKYLVFEKIQPRSA